MKPKEEATGSRVEDYNRTNGIVNQGSATIDMGSVSSKAVFLASWEEKGAQDAGDGLNTVVEAMGRGLEVVLVEETVVVKDTSQESMFVEHIKESTEEERQGLRIGNLIDKENFIWVMENVERISSLLGVIFDGLEEKAMDLLFKIEKSQKEKVIEQRLKTKTKGKQKEEGCRELRRLQTSINYDKLRKRIRGVIREEARVDDV